MPRRGRTAAGVVNEGGQMPEAVRREPYEPLVTVVTPVLNGARFIGRTINSVLVQDYPHVEYLVMDGGSTDGTLDVLASYGTKLRVVSGPDSGQADAVNRGVALTRGAIVAYLNADDTYAPGALSRVVDAFARRPDAALVYGEASYVDADDRPIGRYPVGRPDAAALARRCIVCQPAAFVRREAIVDVGLLDARLQYSHDYDLWIRLMRRFPAVKLDAELARARVHPGAKTVRHLDAAMRETFAVQQRHFGAVPINWLYGYAHQRVTGRDIVLRTPGFNPVSAGYALALWTRYNGARPARLLRDLLAVAAGSGA